MASLLTAISVSFYLFGELVEQHQQFVEVAGEMIVVAEAVEVETNGQNVAVALSDVEAVLHEGEAFVAHLVEPLAFVGAEGNQTSAPGERRVINSVAEINRVKLS